jgi:hypothetical protein
MTVMCVLYFGIPQGVVRDGKLKELSCVATKLLMALWYQSQRNSTRELVLKTSDLEAMVGGSRNSYAKARRELIAIGLVKAEPLGQEGFVYHLCNPDTGEPWPLDPRERPLYQKAGRPSLPTASASNDIRPRRRTKSDLAGVNFPFGDNDFDEVVQAPRTHIPAPSVTRTSAPTINSAPKIPLIPRAAFPENQPPPLEQRYLQAFPAWDEIGNRIC